VPQSAYDFTFHIEHVIAKQHGGADSAENSALCCPKCNRKKGPNLSGLDPTSGALTPLFNPRKHVWSEHFRWQDALIVGTSSIGRTTVGVLGLNEEERVELRLLLIGEGLLPAAS
jgi:hypothetical protein